MTIHRIPTNTTWITLYESQLCKASHVIITSRITRRESIINLLLWICSPKGNCSHVVMVETRLIKMVVEVDSLSYRVPEQASGLNLCGTETFGGELQKTLLL